jgi:hypothetical protein
MNRIVTKSVTTEVLYSVVAEALKK